MAILSAIYGGLAYLFFLAVFLYAIAFVGDFAPFNSLDAGRIEPAARAASIDAVLLALFAVQHSVMARPAFKRWWARFVPASIERSTYVLAASLVLALLCWQWRPIPQPVWIATGWVASLLWAVFWLGWGILLLSTFLINHFELFGLSQVYAQLRARKIAPSEFKTPFLYRLVRHPIYLGFLLAFWCAPYDDGGTSVVCDRNDRLYFSRNLPRGARSRHYIRRSISNIQAACVHDHSAPAPRPVGLRKYCICRRPGTV
jgi:protein-S-isoprenylcysteine O-methyltransferase Ste14